MAHYIGRSSNYLFQKNIQFYVKSVGLFILACVMLWSLYKFFGRNSYLYILLAVFVVFPLMTKMRRRSFYYKKRSDNFESGIVGENNLQKELRRLDDSYTVFQDLHTPGRKANIDFVVVGPTGVFVIEAKNVQGGNAGTRQYYLKETSGEYWHLFNYLKDVLKTNIFITPILAFSTVQGINNLSLGSSEGSIHVLPYKDIVHFITSQPTQNRSVTDDQLLVAIQNITEKGRL